MKESASRGSPHQIERTAAFGAKRRPVDETSGPVNSTLQTIRTRVSDTLEALHGRSTSSGAILFANIASFVLLCCAVFSRQAPVVMFRYDGTFLLSTALNQRRWMGNGLSYTMNFLEGNGGLWWAQIDTLFDPAFIVASLVSDVARWPNIAFTIYASEFFAATLLLGYCLGLRLSLSLSAAWLGSLAAFPFFVPTLSTDILWGNPHAMTAMSLLAVSVWLLQKIGRGRWVKTFAASAGLFAICAYLCLEFAGAIVQLVPAGVIVAAGCFCAAKSGRERRIKLAVLGLISLAIVALFGRFLLGLYLDTKGIVFPNDMWARPLSLSNLSHLLASNARFLGPTIWFSSLGGAVLASVFGTGRLRIFALCTLAMVLGIAVEIGAIKLFVGDWRSFNPAYFDIYWFPFYALFSVCLFATAARLIANRLQQRERLRSSLRTVCLLALAMLPWLSLAKARYPYDDPAVRNEDPWRWPPRPTEVTEFLKAEIGLAPGSPVRGRVANLAGATFDKNLLFAPFSSQHNYDQIVLWTTGNDHRLYGLWYFSIPTLIESNHFSSPFFHLIARQLLNSEGIVSGHAQTDLTKFDVRILAMLGTRYVITDREFDNGAALRLKYSIDPYRTQYLYEIEAPNLAGYSPTKIHQIKDAATAVQEMADPKFDFQSDVILDTGITEHELNKASATSLRVFRDHLELSAESTGRSILVLPVEYSNCLEFALRSGASEPIEIRRANLEQTAIAFSQSVSGSIALGYGPFRNPGCRLADYRDAQTLRLGDVPPHQ